MKVRIGIDVGGTFTDAVVIDESTYELIGTLKIPTTHDDNEGVAAGIIRVIQEIMDNFGIQPDDVAFIAHGTTQATNALLEGDVVSVGIIGMGHGLEGIKAKSDTQIGDIGLAPGKYLKTRHRYADVMQENTLEAQIKELQQTGCEVVVASAAFSVDDPSAEKRAVELAIKTGLLATGSHEISKLYGLKIRTRTAVINASILPKMMETADMTERSVQLAGIKAPLMIMRCDGGVMDVNEVRKRPILTMLSGPAAGVAGALMYEKISNGIFLETGGTSTDISAIRNGKVMVDYAEIGGHKTYLHSLDVRTVGIGGGSMIQIDNNGVLDVGPRSAHIAGLKYAVFTDPDEIVDPEIALLQPKPGDPVNYAAIRCKNNKEYAITLSCAANVLGLVNQDDYSYGNWQSAYKAFEPFARRYNTSVEKFAQYIMQCAAEKNAAVVKKLIADYKLDPKRLILVGGGGGATALVPYLAVTLGMEYRIAKNAEVISPIGVALAMVREVVERTMPNPTYDDVLQVRKEAEQAAINSGAAPGSIEFQVEVEAQRNIVRVIAIGTTELRTKDILQQSLSAEEVMVVGAKAMGIDPAKVQVIGKTEGLYFVTGNITAKRLFGLLKSSRPLICIIDKEGVVRVQKDGGRLFELSVSSLEHDLDEAIESCTIYGDGGRETPDVFLVYGKKIIDFCGLIDKEQINALAKLEVKGLCDSTKVYALICSKRGAAG